MKSAGRNDAPGAMVTDPVPAGVRSVSRAPMRGALCARLGVTVVAALLMLSAGPLVPVAHAAPISVTTASNGGAGSLRQAIVDANATTAADTITFAIPPSGAHVISLLKPLPAITAPLVIDGTTQPGFAGSPLIRIDNATGSASAIGLDIVAGASDVSGLAVTGFGTGIRLRTGDGNMISGCWLGLDLSANAAGNGIGLLVSQSSASNVIGGSSVAARNVISGNSQFGVELTGSGTKSNLVQGNRIGTNPGGTAAITNGSGVAIDTGAAANTVGGTVSGARNLISGNLGTGVQLFGSGTKNNVIAGNRIGTNAAGTAALPNSTGVGIEVGPSGNTVGGSIVAARNLISGDDIGLYLSGSGTTGNVVSGNFIGTDAAGTGALGNVVGVIVDGATGNTIGGTVAGARNVISANPQYGVWIRGAGTTGNRIQGNRIGTNAAGTTALGNGQGVRIDGGASGNTVGGSIAGAGNLISGQSNPAQGGHYGVWITESGTTGNTVAGNSIGLNAAGTGGLANYVGVQIDGGASGNTIGGTTAAARNVISGNYYSAIRLADAGTTGNLVEGNYLGTDAAGAASLPNGAGVALETANGNTIGGTTSAARNVISGNLYYGVTADYGATGNTIEGNYIGTDAAGTAALGNGNYGVGMLSVGGNTVGGATAGAGNVISGNGASGVFMEGYGTGPNPVIGNLIGTDAAGTGAIGNGHGVVMEVFAFSPIGGTSPGEGNTIAFNAGDGVIVDASAYPTNYVSIEGNSIHSNGGLGIHLVAGANDGQAAPAITGIRTDATGTRIRGTLTSGASTTFRIELFVNPACDPSGAGEGQTFLTVLNVSTDGAGNASFLTTVAALASGQAVTATATNLSTGDTSQFSTCSISP